MYSLDVPAQFGLTSGDVQRTVSADVETVVPMSLEPFSLVANGVQEPVLYASIFICACISFSKIGIIQGNKNK